MLMIFDAPSFLWILWPCDFVDNVYSYEGREECRLCVGSA